MALSAGKLRQNDAAIISRKITHDKTMYKIFALLHFSSWLMARSAKKSQK